MGWAEKAQPYYGTGTYAVVVEYLGDSRFTGSRSQKYVQRVLWRFPH